MAGTTGHPLGGLRADSRFLARYNKDMGVFRIFLTALLVIGLLFAGAVFFDPERGRDPEAAIRAELRETTSATQLAGEVEAALGEGDFDTAVMYADIAAFAGLALPQETRDKIAAEATAARRVARGTGGFISGYVTGEGLTPPAFAGAVASDLTVVGDLRDIATEGTKLITGEPYNELILGLSVVGVSLTTAALASGGATLPAKWGVSVLKVARRAGTLTTEFAGTLGRLVRDAVNPPALEAVLRSTRLSDPAATRAAVEAYTAQVRTAELFPTLAKLEDIKEAAGAGEAVRLLRTVRSTDDLDEVAAMSRIMGSKTRGVIEITGKTSLRLFKGAINIVAMVVENLLTFLAWLGSALSLLFSGRIFRFARV